MYAGCAGLQPGLSGQPVQPGQSGQSGGSWYPLKPQQIPVSVPENNGGKWYANAPMPVPAQNPPTITPVVTGRPPWKPTGGTSEFILLFKLKKV